MPLSRLAWTALCLWRSALERSPHYVLGTRGESVASDSGKHTSGESILETDKTGHVIRPHLQDEQKESGREDVTWIDQMLGVRNSTKRIGQSKVDKASIAALPFASVVGERSSFNCSGCLSKEHPSGGTQTGGTSMISAAGIEVEPEPDQLSEEELAKIKRQVESIAEDEQEFQHVKDMRLRKKNETRNITKILGLSLIIVMMILFCVAVVACYPGLWSALQQKMGIAIAENHSKNKKPKNDKAPAKAPANKQPQFPEPGSAATPASAPSDAADSKTEGAASQSIATDGSLGGIASAGAPEESSGVPANNGKPDDNTDGSNAEGSGVPANSGTRGDNADGSKAADAFKMASTLVGFGNVQRQQQQGSPDTGKTS